MEEEGRSAETGKASIEFPNILVEMVVVSVILLVALLFIST